MLIIKTSNLTNQVVLVECADPWGRLLSHSWSLQPQRHPLALDDTLWSSIVEFPSVNELARGVVTLSSFEPGFCLGVCLGGFFGLLLAGFRVLSFYFLSWFYRARGTFLLPGILYSNGIDTMAWKTIALSYGETICKLLWLASQGSSLNSQGINLFAPRHWYLSINELTTSSTRSLSGIRPDCKISMALTG